ncbi:MAG: hypothetical protein DRQ47_09045, partial [Gammaproteobacteria bacterium]
MAIDFPTNPNVDDVYTDPITEQWFTFNGAAWIRNNTGPGIPEAPIDGVQYARQDGEWAKLAPEILFLGHFAVAPIEDNYGAPLVEGHLYFDTVEKTQKTWDGAEWKAFATKVSATDLAKFVWILPVGGLSVGVPISVPDDYGNTPANWESAAVTKISVYRNGVRLIEDIDVAVQGEFVIDYVTSSISPVITPWLESDSIVIQEVFIDVAEEGLHPYVASISGDTYLELDETSEFLIFGGNFDQNTNVESDGLLRIIGTEATSDKILKVTVQGYSLPTDHPITVYNSDRIQFGENVIIHSVGSGFEGTVAIPIGNDISRTLYIPFSWDTEAEKLEYDCVIDWGDGSVTEIFPEPFQGTGPPEWDETDLQHVYAFPGTYDIKILGVAPYWGKNVFYPDPGQDYFIEINQLGYLGWKRFGGAFAASPMTDFSSGFCDTSGVTSLGFMLFRNRNLLNVDLSTMDISNVTSLERTFAECALLTNINCSNWDTSAVVNMSSTFTECSNLVSIDLSSWNVSAVTTIASMFYRCYKIESINTATWVLSSVTDTEYAFSNCQALTTLDTSSWDVTELIQARFMFGFTYQLTQLDVSTWNTSNLENIKGMFENAAS